MSAYKPSSDHQRDGALKVLTYKEHEHLRTDEYFGRRRAVRRSLVHAST
jgi:hypothetical protein